MTGLDVGLVLFFAFAAFAVLFKLTQDAVWMGYSMYRWRVERKDKLNAEKDL